MVNETYTKAMTEVYYILNNTDENLVKKIPRKIIEFIKENINENYKIAFDKDKLLSEQKLLPETEDFLSLIYRSYWATEEEKIEFAKRDKEELQKKMQEQDIQEIWKNKKANKKKEEIQLVPIKEKSKLRKLFEKIKKFVLNIKK